MTKRIDYQNQEDHQAVQEKRTAELRAFHKNADAEADRAFAETAKAIYTNPNPGMKPVEGTDEQPNASAEIEEATPAEQAEAVEKQAEREAEVHPPIEEAPKANEVEEAQEEEAEEVEEEAPKADDKPAKETAAQKKAREAKEAKADK